MLQYHGFLLKEFEEPYMVKEGPFLNADSDYPTEGSQIVHKKRSGRIIEDVFVTQVASLPLEIKLETQMRKAYKEELQMVSFVHKVDEEMPRPEATSSPKDRKPGKAFKEIPIGVYDDDKNHYTAIRCPFTFNFSITNDIPKLRTGIIKRTNSGATLRITSSRNFHSHVYERPFEIVPKASPSESSLGYCTRLSMPPTVPPSVSIDESLPSHRGNEDETGGVRENYQDKEIAEAKLKLFLRLSCFVSLLPSLYFSGTFPTSSVWLITRCKSLSYTIPIIFHVCPVRLWRRRASKLRMFREQRQLAENATLDLSSLGSPIPPCAIVSLLDFCQSVKFMFNCSCNFLLLLAFSYINENDFS